MSFLEDSSIWLAISFVLFIFVCFRFGRKAFIGLLDKRIEDIKKEIDTAESLRVEAQELLAQYQRKHRDAVQEAENIIANAEKSASEIRKNAEKSLKENLERREKQLEERLRAMENDAVLEIQKHAANLAIHATAQIIDDKMDSKSSNKLVDDAISKVGKNLH